MLANLAQLLCRHCWKSHRLHTHQLDLAVLDNSKWKLRHSPSSTERRMMATTPGARSPYPDTTNCQGASR